ncbi:MAG: hypothetical protein AAGJ83_04200 [Planctomycetota bacterium]
MQDQERLLVSQLSDAVAKTASHFSQLQDAANEWKATEQEVDARLFEFSKGTTPVNVVLQSQQRRADAQLAYYQALTEYNKSINFVDYLKGTLLANNSIELAEGPWHTKAYCDALERARERSAGFEYQYGVTRPGVVRRGPLNANRAMEHVLGLPPVDPGMVRQMEEQPLQEMGEPSQMFAPNEKMEELQRILPEPDPNFMDSAPEMVPPANGVPSGTSESSILDPAPIGSAIEPMSYETAEPVHSDSAPAPVRRKRVPHQVNSPPTSPAFR